MKNLTPLNRNKGLRGTTAFGCLIFLILVVVLSYVGFKFGEAFWNYFEVRFKVQEAMNWAVAGTYKTEVQISEKVTVNVAATGVELKPRNIKIQQTKDSLIIYVFWERKVEFPYYSFPMKFNVTLTGEKRWEKGPLILK
jgi:hypothetical protein